MRRGLSIAVAGALLALLALLALSSGAEAHRDLLLHDGVVRLGPGETLALEGALHYHRLVGLVRAVDAPEAALSVTIDGPEGARLASRGAGEIPVNVLVACCKGEASTLHGVRVTSEARVAVDVALRLVGIHDGLAVAGDDAEGGAMSSMVGFFAVTALVLAWRLSEPPKEPLRGSAAAWTGRALGLHAALWAASAALAVPAMAKYGGGPAAGTVAATADLPWTDNPILNTHALVQLAMIAAWIASAVAWTAAARRARGRADVRKVALAGLVLGAGAIVASAAWAIEYDRILAPALVAFASAALPLGGSAWLLRRAPAWS